MFKSSHSDKIQSSQSSSKPTSNPIKMPVPEHAESHPSVPEKNTNFPIFPTFLPQKSLNLNQQNNKEESSKINDIDNNQTNNSELNQQISAKSEFSIHPDILMIIYAWNSLPLVIQEAISMIVSSNIQQNNSTKLNIFNDKANLLKDKFLLPDKLIFLINAWDSLSPDIHNAINIIVSNYISKEKTN